MIYDFFFLSEISNNTAPKIEVRAIVVILNV